jgi:hypothetical protein
MLPAQAEKAGNSEQDTTSMATGYFQYLSTAEIIEFSITLFKWVVQNFRHKFEHNRTAFVSTSRGSITKKFGSM